MAEPQTKLLKTDSTPLCKEHPKSAGFHVPAGPSTWVGVPCQAASAAALYQLLGVTKL